MDTSQDTLVPENAALDAPFSDAETFAYRRLSPSAAACLTLGALSAVSFLDWTFAVVPLVGLILGGLALLAIRRLPDELTGAGMARLGLALNGLFLVGGPSYLAYEYLTEVPEGYTRVTFKITQTDKERPSEPKPEIAALNGSKVFVRGYIRAAGLLYTQGLQRFTLVKDNGECCFGAQAPAVGDMMDCHLPEGTTLDYASHVFRVLGTLRIEWDPRSGVLYHLDVDRVL